MLGQSIARRAPGKTSLKYDLRKGSWDPGAGIVVEASLAPSTAAAALVWGNFAEEWALVGSANEVPRRLDLNACSGHHRTARMARTNGGPRDQIRRALFFLQIFVSEEKATLRCLGYLVPRKRARSTAARG